MTTVVEAAFVAAVGVGVIVGAAAVQAITPAPVSVEMNSTLLISAIVGGVVTVIGAVTAAIVTISDKFEARAERREAKVAREKSEVDAAAAAAARKLAAEKLEALTVTATEIHTTANGTLSKANEALTLLHVQFKAMQDVKDKEIDGYRQQIVLLNEARTAAVAATTPETVPPQIDSI